MVEDMEEVATLEMVLGDHFFIMTQHFTCCIHKHTLNYLPSLEASIIKNQLGTVMLCI